MLQHSEPKSINLKIRGHKLTSGVWWPGPLKKEIKGGGHKTRAVCNEQS